MTAAAPGAVSEVLLRLVASSQRHHVVSLSLPALVLRGEGDAVGGCVAAVAEAVAAATKQRARGRVALVLHLPGIEVRGAGASCHLGHDATGMGRSSYES